MVDFIITDFESVRGGGNIVDTVPSTGDFIVDNCTISSVVSGEFVLTPGASLVDSVSLYVSPVSVTVGGSVVLTATVLDDEDEPLEDVLVSFYRSGTVIGSDTSDSTGVASFTATMSSVGSFTLTAVAGGVSSSSVTVTVSKVASTISLSAQSSSVLVGSDVVLNGTLSVGSGESVKILQRGTLIDTVTTTSGGAFTETVSNLGVGNYNFYAVYEGNSVYDEVTSSAVSVTVSDVTPTPVVTSVSLTSDKSILSAYDSESAVLSATVLDGSSNPMSGETVTFYKGSTSIGTATTNSSGIATKSYSATGAGDVTFKASVGMIVSETYSIEDLKYYDPLTTNKGHWTIPSGANVAFNSNGMVLSSSSSWKDIYLEVPITKPCEIEYEIASWTGSNSYHLYLFDSTKTNRLFHCYKTSEGRTAFDTYPNAGNYWSSTIAQGSTVTIKVLSDKLELYVDGDYKVSKSYTMASPLIIGLITASNRTTTYKNLKVKPIQ